MTKPLFSLTACLSLARLDCLLLHPCTRRGQQDLRAHSFPPKADSEINNHWSSTFPLDLNQICRSFNLNDLDTTAFPPLTSNDQEQLESIYRPDRSKPCLNHLTCRSSLSSSAPSTSIPSINSVSQKLLAPTMSSQAKSNITLTVEPATTQHENSSTSQLAPNVFDTPKTLSPSNSRDGSLLTSSGPTRTEQPQEGKPMLMVDTNADLEKGTLSPLNSTRFGQPSPLYSPCREYSFAGRVKECTMWPSRQTLEAKAHKEKTNRRAGNCYGLSSRWGELTRLQRILVRIIICLVVVGLGVGLGVGISQAVGGGVYASKDNQNTTIPKSS